MIGSRAPDSPAALPSDRKWPQLVKATSKYRKIRRYRHPTSGLVQGKVINSSPDNSGRPCDERGGACDVIYFLCISNVVFVHIKRHSRRPGTKPGVIVSHHDLSIDHVLHARVGLQSHKLDNKV